MFYLKEISMIIITLERPYNEKMLRPIILSLIRIAIIFLTSKIKHAISSHSHFKIDIKSIDKTTKCRMGLQICGLECIWSQNDEGNNFGLMADLILSRNRG